MTWVLLTISLVAGYILGGIPFPYLLGKLKRIDLFEVGTRNPGAANLFRKVSRPLGVMAVFLDIAKGAGAVLVAKALGLTDGMAIASGLAAVVGHWYSLFLRLRGGEALATCVGIALAAATLPTLVVVAAGLPVLARWRNTGMAVGVSWLLFLPVAAAMDTTLGVTAGVFALGPMIALRSQIRAGRMRFRWP